MISFRRLLLLTLIALIPVMLTAQELTVEQSYLQQSIEHMIIREMSRAEGREAKLVALEYIGSAIERGNLSDEVRTSLEYMALEGVANVTRENGRITNNLPDIRVRAARYLGEFGTPEAKDSLIRMVLLDDEPMVTTEAIRSLANIGINEGGETVGAIVWMVDRFNRVTPNDILALSAIEAFEAFAAIDGFIDPAAIQTIRGISSNYRLTRPVRERALLALDQLIRLPPPN